MQQAFVMHTDGGSRGNPGPAAIGFSIEDQSGATLCEGGWPIGRATNNEAEYKALIWGLRNALASGVRALEVYADSELMVKQVTGAYKVKNAGLKPLNAQVKALAGEFESFSIVHVLRSSNKRPDQLVNQALDAGKPVGSFREPFDKGQDSLFAECEVTGQPGRQADGQQHVAQPHEVAAALEQARSIVAQGAAVLGGTSGFGLAEDHGHADACPRAGDEEAAPAAEGAEVVQSAGSRGFGKTVLLGVTGCIAAYKSCELLRYLQKAGVRVKVVMTEHATQFVGPATFRALTHEPVAVGLFDAPGDAIHHISLAKEADLMLIAPATADVLAKLASGVADDLLTTTALATTAPIVVAPAMNVNMWRNQRTQRAVEMLQADGVTLIAPDEGYLSCGDTGEGRLADIGQIGQTVLELLEDTRSLQGKQVLVTSGPTHEPIDPVRYIGNRSSGLTGMLVAAEAARRGARVTLVTGPVSLKDPQGVEVLHVQTAQQMLQAVRAPFESCDAAVFCAAVADFRPKSVSAGKIKKSDLCDECPTIELVRNPDIIKTLAANKGDRFVVGFAAETGQVIDYAREKLVAKNADLIVANDVSDPALGFGTDDNRVWFVSAHGVEDSGVVSKRDIARQIVDRIAQSLGSR